MAQRRPPEAIQWHEGMLLSPQHFQQSALRAEGLVDYHVSAANPFHWGIRRLQIDSSALVAGQLRVVDLEAVMPDGLLVHHPAEGAEDLQIDLGADAEGGALGDRPITIHLCAPARLQDGSSRGVQERYRSVEGPAVLDENLLENEIRIPRLVPRLSLYAGDNPPQRFVSFPLMEVVYRDEAFVLGDFMPPCLQVTRDTALSAACQQIATRLREKAAFLAERMGGGSSSIAAQENQRMVHRLVGALPPFEAMLATGVAHPYQLYLAVCQLTGQLAGLGQGQMPPVPAAYRHNDLRGVFRPLLAFLQQRLDSVQVSYRQIAFNREDNAFYVDLQPDWLDGHLVVGVRRRQGQGEAEVQEWLENALICSAGRVQSMVERRVLGAARRRIEQDDRLGVTPGRDTLLFAVEADPAFVDGADMLVVLDRRRSRIADAPAELVLYVPESADEETAPA